jgi:hypothetical protein
MGISQPAMVGRGPNRSGGIPYRRRPPPRAAGPAKQPASHQAQFTSLCAAGMPFDLPAGALPVCSAGSWARALNYRDFQDKTLRLIQYSSRGAAFWLLRGGGGDGRFAMLGATLFRLYKGLSLSRKAFRCMRSLADLHKMWGYLSTALVSE